MAKKITKKEKQNLTVHGLLGALSYWGTAARMVLMVILLGSAYALNISLQTEWQDIDVETMVLIYGLGTIFVLDAGYVIAARALKMNQRFDRWAVMLSDLLLASFFVVPSFFVIGDYSDKLRVLSLFVALLIVSMRLLAGLLFAKRK